MRRTSAISALLGVCYALIAPFVFADADSTVPACCRRNGAHHCSMPSAPSDDAGLQAVPRCPEFPATIAAPVSGAVALPENSTAIFAELVSHPSVHVQTEAHYRIAFSRSRQKRGPPVVLA